jgi:hypothetical protein
LPLRLALRRRDSGGPGDSRCVDLDARGSWQITRKESMRQAEAPVEPEV